MASVIVFGGYGVFGSRIAAGLAKRGHTLTIAGRNPKKADALARRWKAATVQADAGDAASCRSALKNQAVAVHCAGPYSESNLALAEACLESGVHYIDIAEDRAYIARLRALHPAFAGKKLSAVFGCSSLPGISGALAERLLRQGPAPQSIRVTLMIGNRNPKGAGALAALLGNAGRRIRAPQGDLQGLGNRTRVDLPPPFGRVSAINFESPEYDLFPETFGVESVVVQVAFEWRTAVWFFSRLAGTAAGKSRFLKTAIGAAGRFMGFWGRSGGAVSVEFEFADGTRKQATALAESKGQEMAVLPAILAVEKLLGGSGTPGTSSAFAFLGGQALLQALTAAGFSVL